MRAHNLPWLFLLPLAVSASGAVAQTGRHSETVSYSAGLKPRLFLDSALLVGTETEIPHYEESSFRFHSEAGVELVHRRPGRREWTYGLALSGSVGDGDGRLSIGPRIARQIRPRWTLQTGAGPAWSTEEENAHFDQGWQVRAGLIYQERISVTLMWQTFPYDPDRQFDPKERLHSVYAGVVFHKGPGALLSLAVWGGLAVLAILYAGEMS